jgi:hypothetical protein
MSNFISVQSRCYRNELRPHAASKYDNFLLFALSYSAAYPVFTEKRFFFKLLNNKRNLLYIRNQSYRAVNTFHHSYKNQSVNEVYSKGRCLFLDPHKTLKAKRTLCRIFEC